MSSLQRPIQILGGGAIGLTIGLALLEAGGDVTIIDPAPLAANASGVAAGMLAPASEALSEPERFDRLRRARDLWPTLAHRTDIHLDRRGAVHVGAPEEVGAWLEALGWMGAAAERCGPPAWISGLVDASGVHTSEDWRLDPATALRRLHHAFVEGGGRWTSANAYPAPHGLETVVAAGFGARALARLAPELVHLTPIKGEILRLGGGPASGAVVRHGGLYYAPDRNGLIVGATMLPGRHDPGVDAAAIAALRGAAAELAPELAGLTLQAASGIRAATPDGWPLVGRSRTPGVWLATGVRRNGWLLAPLVAQVLLARMRGDPVDDDATAWEPTRFG